MRKATTTPKPLPKEQRLVRDDKEIIALQHSLAARFGYWMLTAHSNNAHINDYAAITFFGSGND